MELPSPCRGTNNVIGIEFCLMNKGHVVIVMPYFPHQRFSVSRIKHFIQLCSLQKRASLYKCFSSPTKSSAIIFSYQEQNNNSRLSSFFLCPVLRSRTGPCRNFLNLLGSSIQHITLQILTFLNREAHFFKFLVTITVLRQPSSLLYDCVLV